MSFQVSSTRIFTLGCFFVFGLALFSGPRSAAYVQGRDRTLLIDSISYSDMFVLPGQCGFWEQVNTNGFGLPSEFDQSGKPVKLASKTPFLGEEGFEVLVFNDQLYLGMEADNALGARLWRTRRGVAAPQSQLDWEEVAAVKGYPFGVSNIAQADHIDSLGKFEGWIYASTANRSGNPQGALIFRSPSGDPGTWEDVLQTIGPGFGKPQNENFKDMQVFDDHLCGGTWNEIDGAEVWCTSDGQNWLQKNTSGFGERSNMIIWSGHVFDGQLYFGLQNVGDPDVELDGDGRLFRTASLSGNPLWEEVFRTESGISWGNILGDLTDYLYISVPSEDGMLVYRSSTGDPGSWDIASLPGFENNPENKAVLADGAVIYNSSLYTGIVNGHTNFSLWRTSSIPDDGSATEVWEQIPTKGMEDPYNIYVQLISFNGALYAWTSNPVNGQQVWRTVCGIHE